MAISEVYVHPIPAYGFLNASALQSFFLYVSEKHKANSQIPAFHECI